MPSLLCSRLLAISSGFRCLLSSKSETEIDYSTIKHAPVARGVCNLLTSLNTVYGQVRLDSWTICDITVGSMQFICNPKTIAGHVIALLINNNHACSGQSVEHGHSKRRDKNNIAFILYTIMCRDGGSLWNTVCLLVLRW